MSQITDRNYVYSFIRTDLSIEDQIVQTAHSALEAGRELGTPNTHTHLILLEIKSQDALIKFSEQLKKKGIKFHMFYEPDDNIGYTSLTTEPLYDTEQMEIFSRFSLFKFRPHKAFSIHNMKEVI